MKSINRIVLILGVSLASIGYVFSIATTSIGLMLFVALWFVNYKNHNYKHILQFKTPYLLTLFFLTLCFGLIYTEYNSQAIKDVIRHLSFIIFPVLFLSIKKLEVKETNLIKKVFIYSNVAFFGVCLSVAIYRQIVFSISGGHFNWYFFYRFDFLEIFNHHPTYISMYLLLSLSFIFFNKELGLKNIITIIHIIALLLYGSRIGYFICFVLFIIHLLNAYDKEHFKTSKKIFVKNIIIGIFCCFCAYNIPIIKERILFTFGVKKDYKFNDKNFIKNKSAFENGRMLIWKDVVELIAEKPVLGYGTGANRAMLLQKYQKEGHTLLYDKKFNAHNTYLELMLIGGIPLTLCFFFILRAIFLEAIKQKDLVILSFFIIIGVTAITETLFRAQGIVFIAFFFCFFLTQNNEK